MRAAIYNPYIDTLGGGERYTISFAKVLHDAGYKVDIQWNDVTIKEKIEKRFGIDLSGMNFVNDVKRGDGYDVCFWLSDGSIPILKARDNFLHFQVPFAKVNGKSLFNRMKFFRIKKIICNSYFTKDVIDNEYGIDSAVLYPPVDVDSLKPKRKENTILYVGRFSKLEQAKRHDVLISTFKKLVDRGLKNWNLILAGGIEIGAELYLEKLKKQSLSYPIVFVESPNYEKLKGLYGHAKLFWSASGFGIDEKKNPRRVEHFGITCVEAMASGAVPLVYSGGGLKEIIDDKNTGFLWNKKSQLYKYTLKLIDNPKLIKSVAAKAIEASRVYEYERFEAQVLEIIK